MPKFRKKPIVIEAEKFTAAHMPDGVQISRGTTKYYFVKTLEGEMGTFYGDWIITGVKGEKYPCKSDIFELTYDEVEDINNE